MPFPHKSKIGVVRKVDRARKFFKCPIETACKYIEVTKSQYYRWRRYCPEYK